MSWKRMNVFGSETDRKIQNIQNFQDLYRSLDLIPNAVTNDWMTLNREMMDADLIDALGRRGKVGCQQVVLIGYS